MRDTKVFRYADRISTLALWWKALYFAPIWGYLAMLFMGGILKLLGNFSFECGYSLILIMGTLYFTEDVLKRKIKIEGGALFFGYRCFKLSDLASIGLSYRTNESLPSHLILNFEGDKTLKLKLSRLKAADLDGLLKLLESHLPSGRVDPMVRMLGKCRKLARKDPSELTGRVLIPYNSHRMFSELKDTFVSTFEGWSRLGPALVFMFMAPVWLNSTYGIYSSPLDWEKRRELALYKELPDAAGHSSRVIGDFISSLLNGFFELITANPLLEATFAAILALLFYSAGCILLKPNFLLLTEDGFEFRLEFLGQTLTTRKVSWSSISSAQLWKPPGSSGPDRWQVRLSNSFGDGNFDYFIDLAAVSVDDRMRLVSGLQRLAPNCSIESELTEAMMPRQQKSYTELWLQSLTTPPEKKSLEPLAPGQTLVGSKYEVIKRLATGGQGLTYLAKESDPLEQGKSGEVVLKETMLPIYANQSLHQQALDRFQQEAKMLERFDSECIVKLIDYFVEDHRGYLVLEHIDGRNLRQVVSEQGPLPEETVLTLALQMCEILRCLHGQGVIHRDFTPDNLMLNKTGNLKLIDFNVAQQFEPGTTGTVVGKHAYLPPEQIRGKANFQSDIYTMGATLYFLLTGRDPEPITVAQVEHAGVEVSETISRVVASCTALSCSKRYKDASQVSAALLGEAPEKAGPGTERIDETSDGHVINLHRDEERLKVKKESIG